MSGMRSTTSSGTQTKLWSLLHNSLINTSGSAAIDLSKEIDFKVDLCPFILVNIFDSFSDRFLPDKAIDLIDEAGSRVRLRHAQVTWFSLSLKLFTLWATLTH